MRGLLALAAAALPLPAMGQDAVQLEASLLSDHRERGLSWSEGRAAAQAYAEASIVPDLTLSARVSTTRGSARHGGADVAVTLRAGYGRDLGLVRLRGGVAAHLFPGGRGAQDYVELDAGAGTLIGPLDLALSAAYVPPQAAIGGSNLYGRARARLGLPGTPVTLVGHVGRSTGHVDDPLRAQRLRPGGGYVDWLLGADYALGSMVFSLAYSDTDIARGDVPTGALSRHFGARIVAGAHLSF